MVLWAIAIQLGELSTKLLIPNHEIRHRSYSRPHILPADSASQTFSSQKANDNMPLFHLSTSISNNLESRVSPYLNITMPVGVCRLMDLRDLAPCFDTVRAASPPRTFPPSNLENTYHCASHLCGLHGLNDVSSHLSSQLSSRLSSYLSSHLSSQQQVPPHFPPRPSRHPAHAPNSSMRNSPKDWHATSRGS